MPRYKSKAQKTWMEANRPDLAKQYAAETPENAQLPQSLSPRSASEKRRIARQLAALRKQKQPFGKIAVNKVYRKIAYKGELS